MAIDFEAVASRLLQQSRSLLAEWFPAGKLQGNEFVVGDLAGSPGESLKINVDSGKWKDFATGEAGGDLISLYAAMHGMKQIDAVRALEGDGTIGTRVPASTPAVNEKPRDKWTPMIPVPETAPTPSDDYYRRFGSSTDWTKLRLVKRWAYRNHDGALLGYACRFEWFEGDDLKKDIVPQTYCINESGKKQWRWRAFSEPRPLYNLPDLRSRPSAPVIVVEGEKKVEALRVLAPQYVGIAWPGGAAAWRKVDWKPLEGRNILCWPDADKQVITSKTQADRFKLNIGDRIPGDQQPGMRAMWEIGHHLLKTCPVVKVIVPDDETLPDGWDCADAVAEGWDWQRFKTWALPRVVQLTEGKSNENANRTKEGAGGDESRPQGDGHQSKPAEQHPQKSGREGSTANQTNAAADPVHGVDSQAVRSGELVIHERESQPPVQSSLRVPGSDTRTADGPDRAQQRAAGDGQRDENPGARNPENRGDTRAVAGLHRADGILSQEKSAAEAPLSQVARWLKWNVERNGNGLPLTNLNNAVRVMEADPALRGLVWFDKFLNRFMTGDPAREWTDADDVNLTLYMQREVGISKMGKDTVTQAVSVMAMRDTRNCVKDWINALPAWDRKARIDTFMADVFGCDLTLYTMAASRNFWISMIARVFRPGCKVDNMIVLEGGQGIFKSSALAAIADPWFAEQHESAQNPKAFAEVLQGKLLVEIAEMDAFGRAEVNTIKKIVSCQSDRFRPAYGRYAADFPRQGIMAGSTNKDDWNRDETGARRFWPISCKGQANVALVREIREQCFAEALAEFHAGASWWNMPDEETRNEQRKRYDADPWMEVISGWLLGRSAVTVNDIAVDCLRIEFKDIDRARQMRIAGVLRALGWTNGGNKKRAGAVRREWLAPGDLFGSDLAKGSDLASESGIVEKSTGSDGSDLDKINQEVATLQNDIPFQ